MEQLTLQTADDLLHVHMQNTNLRKHCYAVGKTLEAFFDYYTSAGKDVGTLSKSQWELAGILHDADWEETTNDPDRHTLELLEWLKDYTVPQELLDVIKSHNNVRTHLKEPQTLLERTLECCDELTGFIVAVALVTPSHKLADVTVERVLKKFRQKEFARQVNRDQILQCKDKLGLEPETFIRITLTAMQKHSDLLGL